MLFHRFRFPPLLEYLMAQGISNQRRSRPISSDRRLRPAATAIRFRLAFERRCDNGSLRLRFESQSLSVVSPREQATGWPHLRKQSAGQIRQSQAAPAMPVEYYLQFVPATEGL